MQTNEFLFPNRLTRRDFLKMSGAAAVGLAAPCMAQAEETPARIGSGAHTYELVERWGQLPAGMKYGFGCGVVVDSRDRVYVTSRSTAPCVAVFDRHGNFKKPMARKTSPTTRPIPRCSPRRTPCALIRMEIFMWSSGSTSGGRENSGM